MKEKQLYKAGTQGLSQQKVNQRKLQIVEDGLKNFQTQLMQQKSKGMLLVAFLSLVFIRLMYTSFEGQVIAKLPF